MTNSFENKICWITGASSGIGRSTALALAADASKVYVSARRDSELQKLVEESPRKNIIALPLDVLDQEAIEKARDKILSESGRIDLIIACAGIYEPLPIEKLSAESARRVMEVNLVGASNHICSCLPVFLKQGFGHIAGVASVVGYRGLPRSGAYGASKAGLIHFLESLRFELEPKGIFVTIINPGFVKTRMTDQNEFEMPFMIGEEKAAEYIFAGLQNKKREIIFPWQMALLVKLNRILPYDFYHWLIAKTVKVS